MWILAKFLAIITRTDRYFPEFEWSKNLWTYNIFRVYEMVFGRKVGVRREVTAYYDKEKGRTIQIAHSLEAVITLAEVAIRNAFNFRLLKIWIPILWTPQGIPLLASPYVFAVAFDTAVTGGSSASPTTWSHTVTGSNPVILFGFIDGIVSAPDPTAVTYNLAALTKLNSQSINDSPNGTITSFLYFLVGPSTGANTASITDVGHNYEAASASYSGTSQSAFTNQNSGQIASSTVTGSLTGVATGSWTLMWTFMGSGGGAPTSGTNWTRRATQDNGGIGDSNATVSGSVSIVATYVNSHVAAWSAVEIPVFGASATVIVTSNLTTMMAG